MLGLGRAGQQGEQSRGRRRRGGALDPKQIGGAVAPRQIGGEAVAPCITAVLLCVGSGNVLEEVVVKGGASLGGAGIVLGSGVGNQGTVRLLHPEHGAATCQAPRNACNVASRQNNPAFSHRRRPHVGKEHREAASANGRGERDAERLEQLFDGCRLRLQVSSQKGRHKDGGEWVDNNIETLRQHTAAFSAGVSKSSIMSTSLRDSDPRSS